MWMYIAIVLGVHKALQNKELTQDELMNAVKARIAEYK